MTTPIATTLGGINPQPRSKTDEKTNWQRLADVCKDSNGITIDENGRLTIHLATGSGLTLTDGELAVDLSPDGGLDLADDGGIQISYRLVTGEIPAGVTNGVNRTFILAHTPLPNSLAVYKSQLRLQGGVHYSLTGNVITFTAPGIPPATNAVIQCDYRYDDVNLFDFAAAVPITYPLALDLAPSPDEELSLTIGDGVMQWLQAATTDNSVELWS